MLPPSLFAVRQFTAANLVTVAVYGALGGAFFLIALRLQQGLHYSPLGAGAAMVPITVIMLLLSARAGTLAQRIGPRIPMPPGPVVAGAGLLPVGQIGAGT